MPAESPIETFVRMRRFGDAPFAAGQVKDEGLGTSHKHMDLSFLREQSVLQAGKKQQKPARNLKKL